MCRVDADQRQVPVRLPRVIFRHLLKYRGPIRELRFRHRVLHHVIESVVVGLDPGRQPQRGAGIAGRRIRAATFKRAATEGAGQPRHGREILLRVRPRPARHRIRRKCQDEGLDCRAFIVRRHDSDSLNVHVVLRRYGADVLSDSRGQTWACTQHTRNSTPRFRLDLAGRALHRGAQLRQQSLVVPGETRHDALGHRACSDRAARPSGPFRPARASGRDPCRSAYRPPACDCRDRRGERSIRCSSSFLSRAVRMFDAMRSGDSISSLKWRLPTNSRSRITSNVQRSPNRSSAKSIGQPESRRLRPSLIAPPKTKP